MTVPLCPRPGAHFVVVFAVVGLGLALGLAGTACDRAPKPPPVLLPVPAFTLTDEQGATFVAAERLGGRPWVANFIFTRCPDVCPMFTAKMAELQTRTAKLGTPPHLVSFSVDPEHDTPERLAAYARTHGADAARWSFLTGPTDTVRVAVEQGLKIEMGQRAETEGVPSIAHGQHFVLVDGQQRIRGYYDMSDADALDRIVRDLRGLAAEK